MKKLITTVILSVGLVFSIQAQAGEGFHHHRCCYRGPGMGWVAPAIVGGIIGYELSRPYIYYTPQPVVIQQPPVYIAQPPYYQAPPAGYHWQEMIDPQTNTTKIVLVPN
jgi:hypothetical protein